MRFPVLIPNPGGLLLPPTGFTSPKLHGLNTMVLLITEDDQAPSIWGRYLGIALKEYLEAPGFSPHGLSIYVYIERGRVLGAFALEQAPIEDRLGGTGMITLPFPPSGPQGVPWKARDIKKVVAFVRSWVGLPIGRNQPKFYFPSR